MLLAVAESPEGCCRRPQVDALLARRKGEGEHEALREIKNEFMSLWDGMPRCGDTLSSSTGHPGPLRPTSHSFLHCK